MPAYKLNIQPAYSGPVTKLNAEQTHLNEILDMDSNNIKREALYL